ncbi:hypothetical protein Barb6_02974 [Bacteroidales bacterium Barb6]|nr:hypothetical protein Barb6_02974 [Bacteroidales bacterium Barb6]
MSLEGVATEYHSLYKKLSDGQKGVLYAAVATAAIVHATLTENTILAEALFIADEEAQMTQEILIGARGMR